jgi:hypothetical protein
MNCRVAGLMNEVARGFAIGTYNLEPGPGVLGPPTLLSGPQLELYEVLSLIRWKREVAQKKLRRFHEQGAQKLTIVVPTSTQRKTARQSFKFKASHRREV